MACHGLSAVVSCVGVYENMTFSSRRVVRLTFTARDDVVEEPIRKLSISQRVSSGMTLLRNAARGATVKAKVSP
jgi:hypothetical protein